MYRLCCDVTVASGHKRLIDIKLCLIFSSELRFDSFRKVWLCVPNYDLRKINKNFCKVERFSMSL